LRSVDNVVAASPRRRVEPVDGVLAPGKPCRRARREADPPGGADEDGLVADAAGDDRVGAEILGALDPRLDPVRAETMSSGRTPRRRSLRPSARMFIGGVPMKRAAKTVAGFA
jgi:hypothetical protein